MYVRIIFVKQNIAVRDEGGDGEGKQEVIWGEEVF